jgi:hypothetical protein
LKPCPLNYNFIPCLDVISFNITYFLDIFVVSKNFSVRLIHTRSHTQERERERVSERGRERVCVYVIERVGEKRQREREREEKCT